jgi:hypothetical protein
MQFSSKHKPENVSTGNVEFQGQKMVRVDENVVEVKPPE